MKRTGPIGNNRNPRLWTNMMRVALLENDAEKLRAAVESVITAAIAGDMAAANHIADRIDGKLTQVVRHQGEDGEPLVVELTPTPALLLKIRGMLKRSSETVIEDNREEAS